MKRRMNEHDYLHNVSQYSKKWARGMFFCHRKLKILKQGLTLQKHTPYCPLTKDVSRSSGKSVIYYGKEDVEMHIIIWLKYKCLIWNVLQQTYL